MMVGAREYVPRGGSQTALARQMLTFWDQSWSKNLAASFLAFLWFGVGGYSVLPVGLLIAISLMIPEVPGWSIFQRIRFAGRRSITLVVLASASLLLAHAQIGVLDPDGSIVYVRPRFLLPTALGWLGAEDKDSVVSHRKACSSGIADSCAFLGRAYLDGVGVDPDPRAAVSYFELACDAGHPLACVSLGRMYSRGIGVDADRTTAKQLYSAACSQGEMVGCHNQGALQLSEGHFKSGMDVLMRACSEDFGRSCFLVGEQYRLGTSSQKKSERRARPWLEKACRLDVKEACELITSARVAIRP